MRSRRPGIVSTPSTSTFQLNNHGWSTQSRPAAVLDSTSSLHLFASTPSGMHMKRSWESKDSSSSDRPGAGIGRLAKPDKDCPPLQAQESAGQNNEEKDVGYVKWPRERQAGGASDRMAYFERLEAAGTLLQQQQQQQQALSGTGAGAGTGAGGAAAAAVGGSNGSAAPPSGRQASSLEELLVIRAFNNSVLRNCNSLGTALGMRIKGGFLTKTPAIITFVSRKVHAQWLLERQKLPSTLSCPVNGGLWCDVDVVEFSAGSPTEVLPAEQIHSNIVQGIRGSNSEIGPGSQVASAEVYGTFGAVVRTTTKPYTVGFITNRHVAVDFDQPKQKMYHPLPPSLGPGVFLGCVERAISFASDTAWYGTFAAQNPGWFFWAAESALGAAGLGATVHLGGSSGLTHGTIIGYAVEYNDSKGVCFLTDFLIVGEGGHPFDMEGDSGSLIVLVPLAGGEELPQPLGIVWGGTVKGGRLKLGRSHNNYIPETWTSGIDLGRLLKLLDLELVLNASDIGLPDEVTIAEEAGEASGSASRANMGVSEEDARGERDSSLFAPDSKKQRRFLGE
eukprot:jgi/Mesen1/6060/ME000309S05192